MVITTSQFGIRCHRRSQNPAVVALIKMIAVGIWLLMPELSNSSHPAVAQPELFGL
jgi:hypothetical protein